MHQIIKQTKEEQFNMYMQLPKKEIANMLIECNRLLDIYTENLTYYPFTQDEEIHKMD